jgi:hypothetical protein
MFACNAADPVGPPPPHIDNEHDKVNVNKRALLCMLKPQFLSDVADHQVFAQEVCQARASYGDG